MIEHILAIIGAGAVAFTAAIVVALAVYVRSGAAALAERRMEVARRQRERQDTDYMLERMEHERAIVRGRIHHRLGHAVIQSSIDELIGRNTVDV
jgi:hypothetical protein